MIIEVVKISIISFVTIFMIHHIIEFFKAMLTVPKLKDYVTAPESKYDTIYNIIQSKQHTAPDNDFTPFSQINEAPQNVDFETMKYELNQFIEQVDI